MEIPQVLKYENIIIILLFVIYGIPSVLISQNIISVLLFIIYRNTISVYQMEIPLASCYLTRTTTQKYIRIMYCKINTIISRLIK